MYTPVYPSFTIQKWGVRGCTLHGHVFMMNNTIIDIIPFDSGPQIPYISQTKHVLKSQLFASMLFGPDQKDNQICLQTSTFCMNAFLTISKTQIVICRHQL